MEQNKWEYRENFHSTGCGDYDGCYEVTDGHIFLCTKDDPEDVTETENALQQIARLMNESGCKFYSNNVLELNQHIEIQKQKYEIEDLRAKCDRYEKALKSIEVLGDGATITHLRTCKKVANEALAGDGEKEVELSCMVCGAAFMGPDPKGCCSGRDCGCMGMPTEPIVCSEECYDNLPGVKNKREDKQ